MKEQEQKNKDECNKNGGLFLTLNLLIDFPGFVVHLISKAFPIFSIIFNFNYL